MLTASDDPYAPHVVSFYAANPVRGMSAQGAPQNAVGRAALWFAVFRLFGSCRVVARDAFKIRSNTMVSFKGLSLMHTLQMPVIAAYRDALVSGASSSLTAGDGDGAPDWQDLTRVGGGGRVCEVGALLLRCEQGDSQAFDELYVRTSRRVFGLVRKILVDVDLSAETTQDIFLAVWVGGGSRFDPAKGSGMSWMMTLAHRRAVDKVRSEESRRVRDLRWGLKNQGVDYDQVSESVLEHTDIEHVRSSLRELSEVQREALYLAYYGGLTYVQVAHRLGIPVPTAKSRIRDGITRLRSHLQKTQ